MLDGRAAAPTCSTPAPTSTTCTRCADGKYVSIGSIEPQFYAELLRLTGLDDDAEFAEQMDRAQWPALKERLAELFKTQDPRRVVRADGGHRRVLRAGADDERGAAAPAQRRTRSTFVERRRRHAAGAGAAVSAAPGAEIARPPAHAGQHTDEVLADWGCRRADDVAKLRERPARSRLAARWPRSSASTPTPTTRRSRRAARWPARVGRGPPGRARRRHSGEHGEVPEDPRRRRDARPIAAARRPSARPRSSASHRVEWLGYDDSGMIGWDAERRPEPLLAGRRRRGGRAAGRRSSARRRPTCSRSTTGTATTAIPTTSRSTGSGTGRPSWRHALVFEATMNRDAVRRMVELASEIGPRPRTAGAARGPTLWHAGGGDHDGRRRLGLHRAQARVDHRPCQSGDRLGFFLRMPPEVFERAFSTEWFIRKGAAPGIHEDMLAGL